MQKAGRKDTRPLIVLDLGDAPPRALILEEEAEARGWRLLNLATTHWTLPKGAVPAGALVLNGPDHRVVKRLTAMEIPIVRIGSVPAFYGEGMPHVFNDIQACGRLGARYFVDRGFRTLAYIGNSPWGNAKHYYLGFASEAESLGCQCHLLQLPQFSRQTNQADRAAWLQQQSDAVGTWLRSLPGPVGLLGYSDRMAARLCTFCIDQGLRVPEDVAILGMGNAPFFCKTAPVSLSSIDPDWDRINHEAMEMLHLLMQGKTPSSETILAEPARVIERQSTDALGVSEPYVRQAILYLWDNLEKNITTDHLVKRIGVCRSKLERGFRHHLGRGINAELRRKRLEEATRLLQRTDLPVYAIAERTGFKTRSYFHRFFSKALGCTPLEYRQQKQLHDPASKIV